MIKCLCLTLLRELFSIVLLVVNHTSIVRDYESGGLNLDPGHFAQLSESLIFGKYVY